MLLKQPKGSWTTSASYQKKPDGAISFPDVTQYVETSDLNDIIAQGHNIAHDHTVADWTSKTTIGRLRRHRIPGTTALSCDRSDGVAYIFTIKPFFEDHLGDRLSDDNFCDAVFLFGMPDITITDTVGKAIAWHVPLLFLAIVISAFSTWYTCTSATTTTMDQSRGHRVSMMTASFVQFGSSSGPWRR